MHMSFLPKLTGSFAMPASENPTVEMVEAAYKHHKMDMRYINVEVGPVNLAKAIEGAVAMGWLGFNCSIPNKIEVIKYIDRLEKSAEIIGAVNCVVIRDQKLIGENTDGKGFIKSIESIVNLFGKNVVVFGAGGAARAICVELAFSGVKMINVVNRSVKRGTDLVALINKKTKAMSEFKEWGDQFIIDPKTDLVINATSIGLFPDVESDLPIDYNSLNKAMIVADVIPNPPKTKFLKNCESIGCRTVDGLGMLVNQGVAGIELWTGFKVDESIMRSRLEEITINSTNW